LVLSGIVTRFDGGILVDARVKVVGLDGIRGLLALYVVLHHCWQLSFRGYPTNNGPGWLGWLVYGRYAVVAFIVLSGFSLALAPARDGWRLGSLRHYLRRRALRILPPYWAALIFSALIALAVPVFPFLAHPDARSVLVYGLLLQDVVAVPAPSGVLWSVAVEAALYLVFPVLLLVRRRAGAVVTVLVVLVPVIVAGLLGWRDSVALGFTLELAPLFAIGVVAAGAVTARRFPWLWLAVAAAVPVAMLMVRHGPVWTVHRYFWLDLAVGPAIALFLVAVATRRPPWLARLLDAKCLRALGGFSYSLYLIHLPIVVVVSVRVVAPYVVAGLPAFWATVIVAVPTCLVAARIFARLFEGPTRHEVVARSRCERCAASPASVRSRLTVAASDTNR
jgi:peptidoglycan/LPS O-acetylase OafA/YrhL